MPNRRVILYKGVYQYDAVNVFVEELGAGIAALGYEAVIIDLADRAGATAKLKQELALPCECVVSFGAAGCDIALGGKPVYELLPFPFVAVLVDHPAHHLDRFGMENIIITCYDRSHFAFLKRYFGDRKKLGFLPHGGSIADEEAVSPQPRPIDILFAGTFTRPEDAYARLRALPLDAFEVMDAVVERMLTTDCMPLEDALMAVLVSKQRDAEWKALCACLPLVDIFVKAYKRLEILRLLDEAGIAVDILGNHWPSGLFKHHRIQPPLPYRATLSLMRRSKIVLNMGFVPDGSHERVFSAMLNGALPASDFNPYLGELFEDGRDILLFRWTEAESLPGRIAKALGEEEVTWGERSSKVLAAGKPHTWAARASSLLEIVRKFTDKGA